MRKSPAARSPSWPPGRSGASSGRSLSWWRAPRPGAAAAPTRRGGRAACDVEEPARGPLPELAAWAKRGVLGEITLVVAGAPARSRRGPDEPGWADSVAAAVGGGAARAAP